MKGIRSQIPMYNSVVLSMATTDDNHPHSLVLERSHLFRRNSLPVNGHLIHKLTVSVAAYSVYFI